MNEKKNKTTSLYRLRAGKIRRILRSDWPPERAKWANLARWGFFCWFVVVFVYFNVVSEILPEILVKNKLERTISDQSDGILVTTFEGPLLPAWSFRRSDRNVSFNLTKLVTPAPLFCILLTRTITKRAVAWVGSVQSECTVPMSTWNLRNFKAEFLLNPKRP